MEGNLRSRDLEKSSPKADGTLKSDGTPAAEVSPDYAQSPPSLSSYYHIVSFHHHEDLLHHNHHYRDHHDHDHHHHGAGEMSRPGSALIQPEPEQLYVPLGPPVIIIFILVWICL